MESNDNFCLRLNSFDIGVKAAWQELQMAEDFYDMTLACQDRQIKTHRVVISSYSLVLRNILKSTRNPHPLIYLRKVKYTNLQNLLTFMYQGEEYLSSFLEVAEDLNIKGLSEGNNSSEADPSYLTPSNFDSSPERNRNTEENETIQNKSISIHFKNEYKLTDDRFIT